MHRTCHFACCRLLAVLVYLHLLLSALGEAMPVTMRELTMYTARELTALKLVYLLVVTPKPCNGVSTILEVL